MAMVQKRPHPDVSSSRTTVQDGPEKPSKRLRLESKSRSTAPTLDSLISTLESTKTSNEAIQALVAIEDNLVQLGNEILESFPRIVECYLKQEESAVRVKILSLFVEFSTQASVDTVFLIDQIIGLLKKENSAKVICQALNTLLKIGQNATSIGGNITRIIFEAKKQLKSSNFNIQRHALVVLGALSVLSDAEKETLDLISRYTDSQDARVRAQAFRTMLTLGERGVKLTPLLYERTVGALKDDYECVRQEALQMISVLGNLHPEYLIEIPSSAQQIRLVDDAFGKICSAICDLSMRVRKQAAELLGGMTKVDNEFLHQTLDKKLMSNLKRKKTLHERSSELYASGEWSSGKRWGDDAPKETVDTNAVSLITSGACGALVHGLEDEFLEVRTAAVDSMCRLALTNSKFAVTCLDFLVDMFNDEIEDVRLRAIYSLTTISKHIILREDQLETMLSSLEDYSVEVREGLHLMLGACKVSTQTCLLLVVQKVLNVLAKYPQDKLSAFGCLQRVGQKHAELCMSLTAQLLQDHPFFDSAEKDVEDPAYICILIMLFNAAQHMLPMISLFPETTKKHYAYLRDTMPNLVPQLPIGGTPKQLTLSGSTGSQQFLETFLNNIKECFNSQRARLVLLEAAQVNLDRLATIDPELSGTANFTGLFLGAQLLIEKLQASLNSCQSRPPSMECLNQLMQKCSKLQNLFSGLTINDIILVKQLCLRASALHLVLIVKDRSQSALGPCQLLLKIANNTSTLQREHPTLQIDSFSVSLLEKLANISDPKPGRVFREILPIVQHAAPIVAPEINLKIRMCTAEILEPTAASCSENIIKVTAGLIAAIPIVVEITNLEYGQRQNLRIRIKYPDQNVHFVMPRMRDLKHVMNDDGTECEDRWRLRTTVLLSHGVWTEASQVDLSLYLSVRLGGHEIELSKPVKVLFAPKPVKRGI